MKKHTRFTVKQVLFACIFLIAFMAITIFLFTYRRDEKRFTHISSTLFSDEMCANTLNMHYTLAHPEDFGIHSYHPTLPVYSSQNRLAGQAATENTLASLRSINPDKLSDTDRLAYQLLVRRLENSMELNRFPYFEEPLSPSSGMQSQLPILLAEYTFRSKRDVTDYLALLNQTDDYFDSLLLYEQEKAAAGLLMPASCLEKVKKQCDTIVTKEELENGTHFLQTTFCERLQVLYDNGEITKDEALGFLSQNNRLLKTVLLPAYEALADGLFVLEDDSIPLSGLASKPNGAEYYRHLLIEETGSYRSLQDITTLLSSKLTESCQAIKTIAAKHPECTERISTEDYCRLPLQNAATMLADVQDRMQTDFPKLNSGQRQSPNVEIKAISSCLENYCAPAFYLTTPIDDTDNNVIYINQKSSPNGLELYTTLAHEGYPGHLYQNVYCNRYLLDNGENKLRTLLWYGGYLEGWALYVEFISFDYATALMQEQNRPQDAICIQLEKHNRSMQLCLYSLLDIMIHYENASCGQTAKILESFGITDVSSAKAIYTYIAENPCNYLKYYLGYLEILELKEEAKSLWGNDYSDYAFHTFYLNMGPSDFASLHEALLTAEPVAYPQSGKID